MGSTSLSNSGTLSHSTGIGSPDVWVSSETTSKTKTSESTSIPAKPKAPKQDEAQEEATRDVKEVRGGTRCVKVVEEGPTLSSSAAKELPESNNHKRVHKGKKSTSGSPEKIGTKQQENNNSEVSGYSYVNASDLLSSGVIVRIPSNSKEPQILIWKFLLSLIPHWSLLRILIRILLKNLSSV